MREDDAATRLDAMYFFHHDGHVPAFALARKFCGDDGRIATLPDVLSARVASPKGGAAWNRYFTTLTAEYYGRASDGTPTMAVMHGAGPLSTNDGIVKAYSHKDEDGRSTSGQVTQDTFESILRGEEGPVTVLSMRSFEDARDAFCGRSSSEAMALANPYAMARLGPDAAAYLRLHAETSATLHDSEDRHPSRRGDGIVSINGSSTVLYGYSEPKPGTAWANLLSIGSLVTMGSSGAEHIRSDVSIHDWSDGTRYLALRKDASLAKLYACPDIEEMLRKPEGRAILTVPRKGDTPSGLREVRDVAGRDGTPAYAALEPRVGACMSGEVDLPLLAVEKTGVTRTLTVKAYGYHAFARFAPNDVEPLRPEGANGYRVLDFAYDGRTDSHVFEIEFLKVRYGEGRYLTPREFLRDFDKVSQATRVKHGIAA